jgi:hypothetical protein
MQKLKVINQGVQQQAAGACEKCWEMLGAAAQRGLRRCGTVKKLASSSPVVLNDIKDLAVLCLNWCTPIPIWVCRHRRDVEPCVDGKSNDIKDLASPGRPGRPGRGSANRKAFPGPGPPERELGP